MTVEDCKWCVVVLVGAKDMFYIVFLLTGPERLLPELVTAEVDRSAVTPPHAATACGIDKAVWTILGLRGRAKADYSPQESTGGTRAPAPAHQGAARRRSWCMGGLAARSPDPGRPVLPSRRDARGWAGDGMGLASPA